MLLFDSFEIRPCVECDGATHSFAGPIESARQEAEEFADANGQASAVFWTLYGLDDGLATAIGDFVTYEAAVEIKNAIRPA